MYCMYNSGRTSGENLAIIDLVVCTLSIDVSGPENELHR